MQPVIVQNVHTQCASFMFIKEVLQGLLTFLAPCLYSDGYCLQPGVLQHQADCQKFWLCKEMPPGSGLIQVSGLGVEIVRNSVG